MKEALGPGRDQEGNIFFRGAAECGMANFLDGTSSTSYLFCWGNVENHGANVWNWPSITRGSLSGEGIFWLCLQG
eukprot:1161960-Pelagomonas_calceolata.AAC.5